MKKGDIIKIGTPKVETSADGKVRLVSDLMIEGETKTIWFEVEKKYGQYLCAERSDAFLIGLLPVAMRRHLDIVCEAPVNERLLFQLRSTLIPLLAKYGRDVHEVKIDAIVDSTILETAGGVGAGISCGVDSLHIVKNCSSEEYPGLKLTHLVLNNVGAFGETGANNQYQWTIDLAKKFCAEYGYEFIITNSNIYEELGVDFPKNHTYLNMFAVYCLQKLWRIFYYGSWGVDFEVGCTFRDNELNDCASYDLVSLDAFSSNSLELHSEGAAYDRFEKTMHIAHFEPAHKYLQVCVSGNGKNCGHCFKCNRTLLTLDALGALDKFAAVFDIENYKKNRHWYLRYLYRTQISHSDKMLWRVYELLKRDITLYDKVAVVVGSFLCDMKIRARLLFQKTIKMRDFVARH